MEAQDYWNNVYSTKGLQEVSWYEESPTLSLNLIKKYTSTKDEPILDIGGGDSTLGECLLKLGYTNITILDISEQAIDRAKSRLGTDASKINWVVSNILDYKPEHQFSVIHDRATFHFLLGQEKTSKYAALVADVLKANGTFIVGTFSTKGPTQCSGLDVQQYSKESIQKVFGSLLKFVDIFYMDHVTPWHSEQNFQFSIFKR